MNFKDRYLSKFASEIILHNDFVSQREISTGLSEITQRWRAGLGTSRNVSRVSTSSLQQRCDGSFFSRLLFAFSAMKGPAKELRLSFMSGEKYVNKIFLLFSGSERAKVLPK